MNAPANIAPARDRYIMIVRHHMPACEGKEMMLRCSILLMRDQATSALRRCSDEAYGLLTEVQRLAAHYAYETMPLEHLAELRHQLVKLTLCASGLEAFAFNRANPDAAGGTDAGGR